MTRGIFENEDVINTNYVSLTYMTYPLAGIDTRASYLLFLGGVVEDVCSEKWVLFIVIIIHPLTEVIANVESPERKKGVQRMRRAAAPGRYWRERLT